MTFGEIRRLQPSSLLVYCWSSWDSSKKVPREKKIRQLTFAPFSINRETTFKLLRGQKTSRKWRNSFCLNWRNIAFVSNGLVVGTFVWGAGFIPSSFFNPPSSTLSAPCSKGCSLWQPFLLSVVHGFTECLSLLRLWKKGDGQRVTPIPFMIMIKMYLY